MKNLKFKCHLFGMLLLGFLMLGLIIASSGISVSKTYEFTDEKIEIKTLSSDIQLKIGELRVSNPSYLPAKTRLNNYVLCYFSDRGSETFYTSYSGIGYAYYYGPEQIDYEISGRSEEEISIMLNLMGFNLRQRIIADNLNGKEIELDLYEVNNDMSSRFYISGGICSELNKENSAKTIIALINVPERELEDERLIYR